MSGTLGRLRWKSGGMVCALAVVLGLMWRVGVAAGAHPAPNPKNPDELQIQAERISQGKDFMPASGLGGCDLLSSSLLPSRGALPPGQTPQAQYDYEGPGGAFQLVAKPSGGWDSNPLGRHQAQGGWFGDFDLKVQYDLTHPGSLDDREKGWDQYLDYNQRVLLSYETDVLTYENDLEDANRIKNTGTISYSGRFADNRIYVYCDVRDTYTHVDSVPYLNSFEVSPSVRYMVQPWAGVELSYNHQRQDVRLPPATPARSNNLNRDTVGATLVLYADAKKPYQAEGPADLYASIFPPKIFKSLSIGYARVSSDAAGSDNSYDGDRLIVKLDRLRLIKGKNYPNLPKWIDLTMTLSYQHDWNQYRHPNTQLGRKARRHDDNDSFTLQFNNTLYCNAREQKKVSIYAQIDYNVDASNLISRDYYETRYTMGLLFQY